MKIKTEVLLSVYSGWVMTDEGYSKIKEVFEYLEGNILSDIAMNTVLNKWQPILDKKYKLNQHFEKWIMPQEMELVIQSAIRSLGEEVTV